MIGKRVAIVTGGTRGIGKAISLALAAQGDIVVAVYRSDSKAAKETETELKRLVPQSTAEQVDLASAEAIKEFVAETDRRLGRIDILVNNAGIFEFCFIEDLSEESFDRTFDINFKSQFRLIKAVTPIMKRNGFGRIVNASSISGSLADVSLTAYGVSKAAINMLTRISSGELGPYGITVNAYAPGIVHTDMTDAMIKDRGDIQVRQIALQSFGKGEDVAALVQYLVSDAAKYITGEIIGVDGGMFKVQNPFRAYDYANSRKEE